MVALTFRSHSRTVPLAAESADRSVRRRIGAAWGLLFLNTLTYTSLGILPIPGTVGQAIAQGALPLAILVLLTVNPKLSVRPNVFLCLVSLLVLDTVITAMVPQYVGNIYRTFRFAEFVFALWLVTPWWGRRDLLLLRCHLRWIYVGVGSVLLGLLVTPGHAFAYNGRLSGVLWPMFPTQVAQYAAIAIGLTVLLWFARLVSGRFTLMAIGLSTPVLLLTHTRTALAAGLAGVLVAGLSLSTVSSRVRKFLVVVAAIVLISAVTLASFLASWLARGEGAAGIASLSGRTNFWALVLAEPRTGFQQIFGFGLSNASIQGNPIDSNWFASYMLQGLIGVVVCAIIVVFLLVAAFLQPLRVERALALFLVTYCLVASFTEIGFTEASTYLLSVTVAASLIISPPRAQGLAMWRTAV